MSAARLVLLEGSVIFYLSQCGFIVLNLCKNAAKMLRLTVLF